MYVDRKGSKKNTDIGKQVDPTGDHDGCMSAFADNGIYLFLDLDTFTSQLNPVRILLERLVTHEETVLIYCRPRPTGTIPSLPHFPR